MSTVPSRVLLAATLLAASVAFLAPAAGPAAAAAGPMSTTMSPGPTPTPIVTAATTSPPTFSPTWDPATQPPGRPGDPRVTAITPNSVTLSWTPSAPGCCTLEGYTVYYSMPFDDVIRSQSAGDAASVTITTGISRTTQYMFWVFARDVEGHSSETSNRVTVVTPASTVGDTTPPSAPAALRITELTAAGPALAWSPSTDDAAVTGYLVYFFDGWFGSVAVATVTGTSVVAPFRSSNTGMHYYYVRARDAAGNLSIASNLVSLPSQPPTPPCRVTYHTTAEWAGGFVAEVTVTNTGTAAVNGWVLTFTAGGDQQIASVWNSTFAQSGSTVTLTAADWNRAIPPGGSVTAGLQGRGPPATHRRRTPRSTEAPARWRDLPTAAKAADPAPSTA